MVDSTSAIVFLQRFRRILIFRLNTIHQIWANFELFLYTAQCVVSGENTHGMGGRGKIFTQLRFFITKFLKETPSFAKTLECSTNPSLTYFWCIHFLVFLNYNMKRNNVLSLYVFSTLEVGLKILEFLLNHNFSTKLNIFLTIIQTGRLNCTSHFLQFLKIPIKSCGCMLLLKYKRQTAAFTSKMRFLYFSLKQNLTRIPPFSFLPILDHMLSSTFWLGGGGTKGKTHSGKHTAIEKWKLFLRLSFTHQAKNVLHPFVRKGNYGQWILSQQQSLLSWK